MELSKIMKGKISDIKLGCFNKANLNIVKKSASFSDKRLKSSIKSIMIVKIITEINTEINIPKNFFYHDKNEFFS